MVPEAGYLALVSASSVVAVVVAAWLWEDGADLTVRLFVAVVLLEALTGALVVAELIAPSRSLMVWIYGVQTAASAAILPLLFLFAVAFTGHRRKLTRPVIAIVLGLVVGVGVLETLNPVLGVVWADYTVVSSPFPYVTVDPTPFSFVLLLPGTLLYYAGMGILGAHLVFGSGVRRTQTLALFVGFLPPFVVGALWSAGALPGPLNGAFVIGSTWSLAFAAWAVFRHQLFDLVPMARETVFEALDEMVVVVDRQRRLLDYNDAAMATFPELANAEGHPVESAIPELVTADEPVDSDVVDAADGEAGTDASAVAREGRRRATRGTEGAEGADGEDGVAGPDAGETVQVLDPDDAAETPFAESFTHYGDAGPREYSVAVTPLRVGGTVEGFALVVRDVTERRQRVRALEQQTAQLERFASTLSHDLRNPLNVAMGRVDLAADADDENLETAGEALDRMEQIIRDTLQLARQGQTIEDRERVALSTLASDAWETTDTGGATLVIDPQADVSVYADETRLRSVFENLFRNAVEHGSTSPRSSATREDAVEHGSTSPDSLARQDAVEHGSTSPDPGDRGADPSIADPGAPGSTARGGDTAESSNSAGGDGTAAPVVRGKSASDGDDGDPDAARDGELTVRLGRHERGFYVEDDGPGVPPGERERVFEYEYTTDDDGTGLGLAIVDAIARAHGWSVEMTEGSGGGARVTFSNVDFAEGDRLADDAT